MLFAPWISSGSSQSIPVRLATAPWITPSENYTQINTEQALADTDSVFYTYQYLIRLRKELPVLTHGDYHTCGAIAVLGTASS